MIGDVFRVRNWDHCQPNMTLKYGLGREKRGRVALMLYLGEAKIDDPDGEIAMKRLNELGWFFKPASEEAESAAGGTGKSPHLHAASLTLSPPGDV